jgi:phi LC3 family holin
MQMNWKVRFKNKVWLSSFIATIVTFAYTIMGMFDVAPEITQNALMNVINGVLMMLSLTGVIVDPTTAGISDSNRAMTYEVPYVDPVDDNNGATELNG